MSKIKYPILGATFISMHEPEISYGCLNRLIVNNALVTDSLLCAFVPSVKHAGITGYVCGILNSACGGSFTEILSNVELRRAKFATQRSLKNQRWNPN